METGDENLALAIRNQHLKYGSLLGLTNVLSKLVLLCTCMLTTIPSPIQLCQLPYSGKFSLVQTFAELLVSPSEEIFVVLVFVSPCVIAARASLHGMVYAAL